MNEWMQKSLLVVACCSISTLANLNLKTTSHRIPASVAEFQTLGALGLTLLVLRIASVSGLSLLTTWVAFRKFGFMEFYVVTSLTYVCAAVVSYFILSEPLGFSKMAGVALVMVGIWLFSAH